jgi:hypothetical protein
MAGREFEEEIKPSDLRMYAKIENHGDGVEGFLVLTEKVLGQYGEKLVADFRHDDGTEESVNVSADLLDKLSKVKVGDYLKIEYVDDRPTPKGSMKIFSVRKAKNPGKVPEKKKTEPAAAGQASGAKAPF